MAKQKHQMACPLLWLDGTFLIKIITFMSMSMEINPLPIQKMIYCSFQSSVKVIDMNAHTRSLQLDAQQSFMPQMYTLSSIDEKDLNQFGKLLLQIFNSAELLIVHLYPYGQITNSFTCRKHRYVRISLYKRVRQLCNQEMKYEERYVCHCAVFYEIRGRYHCLFKQGFDPLHNVVGYEYQGAETHREVVEGLQLIHREQYDFFSYIIPG